MRRALYPLLFVLGVFGGTFLWIFLASSPEPGIPAKAGTINIEYETHLTEKANFQVGDGACLLVEQKKESLSVSFFRTPEEAVERMNKTEHYRRQIRAEPYYTPENGFSGLFIIRRVPLESRPVPVIIKSLQHYIRAGVTEVK